MGWVGFAAVGIGAAIGAWLRWGLSVALNTALPQLPLGTLLANLVGGYFIGIAVEVFREMPALAPEWRLFAVTGFLGGLTTFSTFSAESLALVTRGEWGWAAAHSALHLAGCLLAAWMGVITCRALLA
jgi:CrcB protein